MPTPEEILSGLKIIANDWQVLAIFWHVYFAILVSVFVIGIRPPKRLVALGLALPLLSVSALAWVSGNPFNGIFFALTGGALLFISFQVPQDAIQIAPPWAAVIGAIMFTFGWAYPHFLETSSFIPYLYAAPTGLIPCPTLSVVIGLSIIVSSFSVRAWSIVLGLTGIFYGVFGAAHLGVSIDWLLLFGALAVIFTVFIDSNKNRKHADV